MSTNPLTPERAAGFIIPIGKHSGQTLMAIDLGGDRDHIRWIARTWCRKEHQRIREAAIAYLTHYPTTPKRKRELSTSLAELERFNGGD